MKNKTLFLILLIFLFYLVSQCKYMGITAPEYEYTVKPPAPYTLFVNTTQGHDGVPELITSYGADVENYWANSRFNPASSSYIAVIKSPEPVVDVWKDFGGDVQAAINSLPPSGGTLFFPPTTYYPPSQGLKLYGKNNVHFIGLASNPAIIKGVNRETILSLKCGGGSYGGYPPCFKTPTKNYYFKNLIFDGNNKSNKALSLYSVKDVVVENCVFKNFLNHTNGGDAMIHSGAWSDNIWIRNCTFTGKGKHAILLDGTHFSGIINNTFDYYIYPTAIVFLSNDDLSRDIDSDGDLEDEEVRLSNYVVVEGNEFGKSHGTSGVTPISGHLSNALIKNNVTYYGGYYFIILESRCSHIQENSYKLDYYFYDVRIKNNTVNGNVNYFAFIRANGNTNCVAGCTSRIGKYIITNNIVNGGIHVTPVHNENASGNPVQGPNTVTGNSW